MSLFMNWKWENESKQNGINKQEYKVDKIDFTEASRHEK